ncbi:LCP family protein [Ruminococcus sp.]|uniref:LCP family glycopolymer transferase n=1 Tax=Ruminococcus sp. TaxID=41978 RepID=UPI0025F91420|nr:LCP family protein [Ruminococcus sp.]
MAKKTGHVAVPFLLTIFIGLIIVGGGALIAWRHWGLGVIEKPSEPVPRVDGVVTNEDNHTLLLILDSSNELCPPTFVLMRSQPVKEQLLLIGIPSNSIALVDDEQIGISDKYANQGSEGAVDFVEKVFDIKVDRYMKFGDEGFKKACDIFGGVSYPVNADIAGFKNDGSSQFLNSDQALMFVTYTMFSDGESERAFTAASVVASMINQTDGQYISDTIDNSFNSLINMTESNITSSDYKERKSAIKYLFEHGNAFAVAFSLNGTNASEDFIPSSSFIASIKEEYFSEK